MPGPRHSPNSKSPQRSARHRRSESDRSAASGSSLSGSEDIDVVSHFYQPHWDSEGSAGRPPTTPLLSPENSPRRSSHAGGSDRVRGAREGNVSRTSAHRRGWRPEAEWVVRLRRVVQNEPVSFEGTVVNTSFGITLAASIVLLCMGTVPSVTTDASARLVFFLFTLGAMLVFTAELALDCIVYRGPWSALVTEPIFIIDVAAIFPFYLEVIVSLLLGHDVVSGVVSVSGLAALRVLRLFRVLHIFKVIERSESLRLLGIAIYLSVDGIAVLFLVSPLLVCFFATLTFYAEQTDEYYDNGKWFYNNGDLSPFQSIPHCFWLNVLTLTTVGFGDVTPRTTAGRLVTAINSIFALVFLAFPLTIINNQYCSLIAAYERKRRHIRRRREAGQASAAALGRGRGGGERVHGGPMGVPAAAEAAMESVSSVSAESTTGEQSREDKHGLWGNQRVALKQRESAVEGQPEGEGEQTEVLGTERSGGGEECGGPEDDAAQGPASIRASASSAGESDTLLRELQALRVQLENVAHKLSEYDAFTRRGSD